MGGVYSNKLMKIVVFLINLSLSHEYVQLSSLKSKMFHKILVNKKIKNDFKKITSNDAYQLTSFWNDELVNACSEESRQSQNINFLYRPDSHYLKNSVNLTDFKYNIISDTDQKNSYYIWRPKIQICLPSLYNIQSADNEDDIKYNSQKTLLYPSFRETMYVLCLTMEDCFEIVTINNIVQSPYWNEPKHNSYEILQFSIEQYFVKYLKHSGLEYKHNI